MNNYLSAISTPKNNAQGRETKIPGALPFPSLNSHVERWLIIFFEYNITLDLLSLFVSLIVPTPHKT